MVRAPDLGSSPALTTKLELFVGGPLFNSSVMLVKSQLACLPPVGIFSQVMFIYHCLFTLVQKSNDGEWTITYTFTYTFTFTFTILTKSLNPEFSLVAYH